MHEIAKIPDQLQLLDLPTNRLLDKLGSGGHKPGSGSAAALLGVVACKLLRTVILLTASRTKYKENAAQLQLGNKRILDEIEPILTTCVQTDAYHFDRVIQARLLKAAATDPKEKRRYNDKHLEELRIATDIPLVISDNSIKVAEFGLTVFDLGFQSARGDSGVAISAALSAANGALFITYLNLKSFKGSAWATNIRSKADAALLKIQELQRDQFKRVAKLQNEGIENNQLIMSI